MDILEHAFRLTKNGAKSLVLCIILLNPSDQTKLRNTHTIVIFYHHADLSTHEINSDNLVNK